MPSVSAAPVPSLDALRQTIRAIEGEARAPERLSLGEPALDALLPEPGLRLGALHEIAPGAHFDGPAALGFALGVAALALAARAGALVWVLARRREFGLPYGLGLAGLGVAPQRLLLVAPRTREEALWASEEALRAAPACVLAELGAEAADLVAARRLQLAAEQGGGLLLLLRPPGGTPALPARTRWRVAAAGGTPPVWSHRAALPAPGQSRWRLRLERARGLLGEHLDLEVEQHASGGFRLVAPLADRAAAPAGAAPGLGALAAGPARRAG